MLGFKLGLPLNIDQFGEKQHHHHIESFNPRTRYMPLLLWVFFNISLQCFVIFMWRSAHLLLNVFLCI